MKNNKIILLASLVCVNSIVGAQAWKAYDDSARISLSEKDNVKALGYFLEANEELRKDSLQSFTYVTNNNEIGDLYVAMGQYANAEPFYTTGKEIISVTQGK